MVFMDKGNRYKKCDLQIHTPRDRNWKGGACVSDDERKTYSRVFISECRDAGLDAVAITDHHDLVFYEYIDNAAKEELDGEGNQVPIDKQITVFPGIEVTLHQPPCQGLLVFDADFPVSLFQTVLGSLSIAQSPSVDSKTSETQPIPSTTINSINDIYAKLDGTDGVKGRYIFLPHIKEGGHKTLMRKGFHEAYANMPCVGGYVDGKYCGGSEGYQKILEGKVEAYGYKSLAVIQTTDYRADKTLKEFDTATWIKWREPTAEALRQACLAKESRISLNEPEIPNIYIEKIDVTNSAFLSKFDLDFNPQLNSIIGGRGSGKSTILEYLRWALCDQTEFFGSDEIESAIEKRRSSLIEKTLKEVGGEVRVFFNVNGTRHIIKRNPNSEDVLLKIGAEDFESVRPRQIRDLLPIQAYSQKQLSSISIKSDELKRFIEKPISKEIDEIDEEIKEIFKKVKNTYECLSKNKVIKSEIQVLNTEIKSLKKQIDELRKGLKGISDQDKSIIDRAKFYTNEKNKFDEVELEYSNIESALELMKKSIDGFYSNRSIDNSQYENTQLISSLNTERNNHLKTLETKINEMIQIHSQSKSNIQFVQSDWKLVRDEFKDKYKAAKNNSSSSNSTLNTIKEIESKIEKNDLSIRQKNTSIAEVDVTEEDFEDLFQEYTDLQNQKTEKLKSSTELFTKLSDGLIVANITRTTDKEKLSNDIKNLFSAYSLNIPRTKSETLADFVSESQNPIEEWQKIVFEFKSLSEFNITPGAKNDFPVTTILNQVGFTDANKRKISETLSSDGVLSIAKIKIDFLPQFFYKTHNEMGDEIPFEDASAGQQATALLNVLLNQDGFPLIIDQPEDDIDNRAIENIIKNLWNSKKSRQIIFSSHNANLVVNGDSELVVCCDYNETSNQTRGHIKYEGSIDKKEIRDEITSVMEGGERAFKLRKEKYGF
jgi:chromosome segregation protein